MATGSNRYLAYIKEVTAKTTPAGSLQKIRTTGGSGIVNNRTSITSDEIRDDRQIITSRLGNNQPDASIPFEFSYASYDDLMQGALGGTWTGGWTASSVAITALAAAGDDVILTSGGWTDYGAQVGDFIRLTENSTADDGLYKISAITTTTNPDDTITVTDVADGAVSFTGGGVTATVVAGWYGGQIASATTVTSATGGTVAKATSWITDGVHVGDKIYFDFTAGETQDGWYTVTAISTDGLTLTVEGTALDGAVGTVAADFVSSTGILTAGTGLDSFTIEEGYTDVSEYKNIKGATVSSWSMSIQPDAVITGEFSMQALAYSPYSASPLSTTIATNNNEVFDTYTGDLIIKDGAGVPITTLETCVITGLDFTLDNGLSRRYAVLDQDGCSFGEGRSNVTGTINLYFPDSSMADLFENETEFEVQARFEDLDTNSYLFGWPRMKLTSDTYDVTENDVTESVGFQALGGNATYTNMYVLRQPASA